jgi:hypothetical protein
LLAVCLAQAEASLDPGPPYDAVFEQAIQRYVVKRVWGQGSGVFIVPDQAGPFPSWIAERVREFGEGRDLPELSRLPAAPQRLSPWESPHSLTLAPHGDIIEVLSPRERIGERWTMFFQRFPGSIALIEFTWPVVFANGQKAAVYYTISWGELAAESAAVILRRSGDSWEMVEIVGGPVS